MRDVISAEAVGLLPVMCRDRFYCFLRGVLIYVTAHYIRYKPNELKKLLFNQVQLPPQRESSEEQRPALDEEPR